MIRKTMITLGTVLALTGAVHAQDTQTDPQTTTCADDYDTAVRTSIGGLATFLQASPDADRWTTGGPGILTPALPGISIKIPEEDLTRIQKHNLPVWVAAMFQHTDQVSDELATNKPRAALKGFTMAVVYATRHSGCMVGKFSLIDYTDTPLELRREMLLTANSIKQYGIAGKIDFNSDEHTRISRLFPNSLITEVERYLNESLEEMKNQ